MKPLPPPPVPGNTERERFDDAISKLLAVPKEAFTSAERKHKRAKRKKRTAAKNHD